MTELQGKQAGGGASGGMKRWLKLLLAGSLALNLAVIGLAAGAAWRHAGFKKQSHRPPEVGAMIFRELDRDTRKMLRQEAGGSHGSYARRREAEAAAVIAALRGAPFEPEALMAELQRQSEARHGFHLKVQQAWVRKVAEMTPQQRAEFAVRMEERIARHRGRRD